MDRRNFITSAAIASGALVFPEMPFAKSDPRKMRDKIIGPYQEREITSPVWLCDSNGRLNPDAIGWSRIPLHKFNLKGSFSRKKRWHYWNVTTDTFLFSFTVSDADFVGANFAYLFDFEKKMLIEKLVVTPFGKGAILPDEVEKSAFFDNKAMPMSLIHKPGKIEVSFECPKMAGKKIRADLVIHKPEGHETLSVAIPWSSEQFQFTSKQNTLPTEGVVMVDDKKYIFEPGKSWATLDFGRGVWPYKTAWNWGTFSGAQDGDVIGINLGGKWTDGTKSNENGLCYNGKLFKIGEDLLWEYNIHNFMEPWRIRTEYSDTLDLRFTPFYNKAQNISIGILKTQVNQCFGHYTGTIKADGKIIEIKKLMGWAEEHIAKW